MPKKSIDCLPVHYKPISESTLKRLLLIFDHVHIIDPKENYNLIPAEIPKVKYKDMLIQFGDYGVLYNGEVYKSVEEQLIDSFDYAYKKGILKIANLRAKKFYHKYWLPLRLAYDYDTANEELLFLTKNLLEKNKQAIIRDGIGRGGFMELSGDKIYPDIPFVPEVFSNIEEKEYNYYNQSFSIIGKINRSLTACGEYDLIPIFLNPTVAQIFIKKYQMAKENNEINVQKEFKEIYDYDLKNVQYFLYRTSEKIVPDEVLEQIPIKDLIIARNNTFHELHKLRRNLISSISYLRRNKFDLTSFHEIEKYIALELEPQLKQYYSKFNRTLAKMLSVASTFSVTSFSTSIGFMQSLNPMEIVFLSGISASVGSCISNLAETFLNKKKEKFYNSYSYFLNL